MVPPSEPPAETAESAEPGPKNASSDALTVVMMALPGIDPELEREATEATAAQLAGISARLVVRRPADATPMPLRDLIDTALRLADEEDATAVFWLEVAANGQLLHFMVEAGRSDRALVRRTGTEAGSRSAQIEAAAVITRRSAAALARGAEIGIGFEEVQPPPPPRPEPPEPTVAVEQPPAKKPRGSFRFALGYEGTTYAPEFVWQSGLSLRAGWRFQFGMLLDVGYTLMQPVRRSLEGIELTVQRHPIEVDAGYRHAWRFVAVEAEMAGVVDYAARRTISAEPGFLTTDDGGRVAFGFGPRVRLELMPTKVLRLYVDAGLMFVPGAFAYVGDLPEREAFLRPWRVRAQTRAGVAFAI